MNHLRHHYSHYCLILTLTTLVALAFHPANNVHLFTDSAVYFDRISYIVDHHTIRGIPFNEYQPGAILFFSLLYPAVKFGTNWEGFVSLFVYLNAFIALLIGLWIYHRGQSRALILYCLLLLAAGPIVLCRFELLVVGLTILALTLPTASTFLSAFILGIATSVKVYPALLLPIFLSRHPKRTPSYLLGFSSGLILILSVYLLVLHPTLEELQTQLLIHASKPVNMESLPAGILQLANWLNHRQFLPVVARIVYGLTTTSLPLPEKLFHLIWLFPCLILFLGFRHFKKFRHHPPAYYACTLLTWFLITNSQLAPQYLIWSFLLLPLFPTSKKTIGLALITLFLTYLIYPLDYLNLINSFWSNTWSYSITLLYLRNIFLLVTGITLLIY